MVFAAYILQNPDVTFVQDQVIDHVRIAEHGGKMLARSRLGPLSRVVGRSGQQDRGALRSARNQNDRVKLHAVPHRDHLSPANVIEALGLWGKVWRDLAD